MSQSMLILKLTNPDRWDNLTLIIRNSGTDDENNIVPSETTMLLRLDGERAKEIFYDIALIVHDAYNETAVLPVKIGDIVYNLSRPYWEALYSVLFRWVQAMTLALNEQLAWDEQL